jgi:hypothetical protein
MLEDIAYFIKTNNIDLEEASISFKLNQNDINIIKLMFAKYFYILEDYENGDKLYQEVEQSKSKNGKVSMFLVKVKNKIAVAKYTTIVAIIMFLVLQILLKVSILIMCKFTNTSQR